MIRQKYIYIVAIFWMLVIHGLLQAQNTKAINVITTAVPFLRIPPDARGGGMGDVGIATTPDVYSVFWNPGKTPFIKTKAGLAASYIPWLREWATDMYLASVEGYYHLDDGQAIHGSLRYFNIGDMQFVDNNGSHLQSYHSREFCVNFGYSRKLSERMGIGIGLKYIYSNLVNDGAGGDNYKTGNAAAADIGFYYDIRKRDGNGWAWGASLTNLGSKIGYTNNTTQKDYLPANIGLGTVYTKVFDEENKLIIGLDINKLLVPSPPAPSDSAALTAYRNKSIVGSWFSSFADAPGGFSEELKEFQISIGTEYWYNNLFVLRAGYFYEDKMKGNRKFFTLGAGIKYNTMGLNFSYLVPTGSGIDRNPLSNTLRFGLMFDFENR